jgi:hypothetical protein
MITIHQYDPATKTAKFWDGKTIITQEYPAGAVDVEWPPAGNASYDEIPTPVEPPEEAEKKKEKVKTEVKAEK